MFLYRFSNYSNLNKNISWKDVFINDLTIDENNFNMPVKIDCFSLSEKDKKNGNYLSFYFANGINSITRIGKCFLSLKINRNNNFPTFFGFCEINKELAEKNINDECDIISFSQEGELTNEETIHYGMKYLTDNESEILEAKTSLVLFSKFFPCRNKHSPRELGCFTRDRKIAFTYKLD